MSIVWLEPFVELETTSNHGVTSLNFTFDKLNTMIYLNFISVLCFIFYYILYKLDRKFRKPPSKKIINNII